MRRLLGSLSVLLGTLLLATPAAAQGTSIGPMAGVGFHSFSGDDADAIADALSESLGFGFEQHSRTGFVAGGFAEFEFGSVFALEPQLLYVQKGTSYGGSVDLGGGSIVDVDLGIKLDYIEVPVLLKAEWRRPDQSFTPSIFAGPAVGFQVGCTITADADGEDASDDCPDDTFKSTDWSLVFGAGVELGRFSLQGRYDMGLQSVADADDVSVKNGGFLITLGYGFQLK